MTAYIFVTGGVVITQVRLRDRETLAELFAAEPFKAGEREIARWVQVPLPEVDQLLRLLPFIRKSYDTVLMS